MKRQTNMKSKLHPSTCFPPNPSTSTILNSLLLRQAPTNNQRTSVCLTLVGQNKYIHSTVAALVSARPRSSIECIKIFDIDEKEEGQIILNDLQGMAAINRMNVRLEYVQSYWQTKDSTLILIHVQHHRLNDEKIASWIQRNTTLMEMIVSQICLFSPEATLIIGTEPNELMTYVAWRVSHLPCERVFGLGASILRDSPYQNTYWTEAMIIVRIIQALLNGQEFQSNFVVNIGLIEPSRTIFLNYPTILGSTHRGIERLLRDSKVHQSSFLIPYEKMQRQIYLSKSKD